MGCAKKIILVEGGSRTVRFSLGAGERLCLTAFVLGGKATNIAEASRTGDDLTAAAASLSVEVDLTDAGAEFTFDALFVGDASINVSVRHLASDCRSRQLVKGIVGGEARGEFAGRIYVAPDAQRTDAEQHSRNIQLSDTAVIVTRPELEIYADDVKCAHGATVGQMDEEAIYYMRQRGVAEADARRMQLEGFALEIVECCADTGRRAEIAEKIFALL